MTGKQGIVSGIAWRDLCPWLVLVRALRLALSPGLIVLSTLGVLASPIGWRLAEAAFVSNTALQDPAFREFAVQQRNWPHLTRPDDAGTARWLERLEMRIEHSVSSAAAPPVGHLSAPFRLLFSGRSLSFGQLLYLASGTLWMLVVWGFIGGVVARVAVTQYGWDEPVSILAATKLVSRRATGIVLAPLFPLGAAALLTAPCLILGWLMRWDFGVLAAGVLWPVVALAGILLAILVLGLACGWPLMPVAVVAEEGGDQFEAFHRSYSYLYGRPLHFALYVLFALLLGAIGALFMDAFWELALRMSGWAVSWGTGVERWREIRDVREAAMRRAC